MCSLHIHKPALIVHGYQSVEPVGCAVWSPHAFLRHYAWPGGNNTTTCPAVFSVLGRLALQGTSTTAPGGGESYPYMGICHGPPRSVRRPPPRAIHTQSTHKESSQLSRLPSEASSTVPRGTIVRFSPAFSREAFSTAPRGALSCLPPPYSSFRPFDIKSCHGAEQRHAAPTIIVMSIDPPPRSHHSPAQLSRSHPVWDRTASWTFSALSRARLRWTSSAQVVVRVITYSGAR